MLVESYKKRDGLPTGCTGVTMEDGTVYRSNRAGHIEVNNPEHIAAMKRNSDGFVVEAASVNPPKSKGTHCLTCGFAGFQFHAQSPCPKCGGPMVMDGPGKPSEHPEVKENDQ
jgi:hypothetical protein